MNLYYLLNITKAYPKHMFVGETQIYKELGKYTLKNRFQSLQLFNC
jgi:hypothetical protein